jgi:hypothetical protein
VPPPARAILDFFISFLTPMGYPYIDEKDPLPTWKATVGFTRDLQRQIRKKLGRRKSDARA